MTRPEKKFALAFLLAGLLLLASSTPLRAQRIIEGALLNEHEPIIGAMILLKGTNLGAVTDLDGYFRLAVPEGISDPVLVVSYSGFSSDEVTAGDFGRFDLGGYELTVSLAFVKICADGYKLLYPKRYEFLLIPWEGAKQLLLAEIPKKKARQAYEEEFSAASELLKLRLGRIWYCFENDDQCKREVRLDYEYIKQTLTAYHKLLDNLREKIQAGQAPEEGIELLSAIRKELVAAPGHQCTGE